MNTGQTMLTILAMTILSVILLNYYDKINYSGRMVHLSKGGLTANTIATSYIERAMSLPFDEATYHYSQDVLLDNMHYFTHPNNLGYIYDGHIADINDFNDFDDFKGYTDTAKIIVNGNLIESYLVNFDVYYVNLTNITLPSNSRTLLKRMNLKIWRYYPPLTDDEKGLFDTIRVSCYKGYYKYRTFF